MKNNLDYQRVIPRDLFNESKLLKCIGKLCLNIHDGCDLDITFEHTENNFQIALEDSGNLIIENIDFYISDTIVEFKSTYNSKLNYPLVCEYEYCEYTVFDDDGNWTDEFINFCKELKS